MTTGAITAARHNVTDLSKGCWLDSLDACPLYLNSSAAVLSDPCANGGGGMLVF